MRLILTAVGWLLVVLGAALMFFGGPFPPWTTTHTTRTPETVTGSASTKFFTTPRPPLPQVPAEPPWATTTKPAGSSGSADAANDTRAATSSDMANNTQVSSKETAVHNLDNPPKAGNQETTNRPFVNLDNPANQTGRNLDNPEGHALSRVPDSTKPLQNPGPVMCKCCCSASVSSSSAAAASSSAAVSPAPPPSAPAPTSTFVFAPNLFFGWPGVFPHHSFRPGSEDAPPPPAIVHPSPSSTVPRLNDEPVRPSPQSPEARPS